VKMVRNSPVTRVGASSLGRGRCIHGCAGQHGHLHAEHALQLRQKDVLPYLDKVRVRPISQGNHKGFDSTVCMTDRSRLAEMVFEDAEEEVPGATRAIDFTLRFDPLAPGQTRLLKRPGEL
jgi:hypothetical protein